MRQPIRRLLLILLAVFVYPPAVPAQETIKEPATGKHFPRLVSFEHGGKDYSLRVTGTAVRKKLIFKGYGVAHYMDWVDFQNKDKTLAAALSDNHAKQITMDFARNIGVGRIRKAFNGDFKKKASEEETKVISPHVDQFMGYFDKDVKENDQFVFRWLPGGVVLSIIQGEEKAPIESVIFATVLWRIWLGEDSVVDREKLVEAAIAE